MKWPSTVTIVLVISSVVTWIAWDPLAFALGGTRGASTESVIIGNWLDKSLWLTFLLFMLTLHLAFSGDVVPNWKHVVAGVLGALCGWFLTRFS